MFDPRAIADEADVIVVQNKGNINDRCVRRIQSFIKDNYKEMYRKWASISETGFYEGN